MFVHTTYIIDKIIYTRDLNEPSFGLAEGVSKSGATATRFCFVSCAFECEIQLKV